VVPPSGLTVGSAEDDAALRTVVGVVTSGPAEVLFVGRRFNFRGEGGLSGKRVRARGGDTATAITAASGTSSEGRSRFVDAVAGPPAPGGVAEASSPLFLASAPVLTSSPTAARPAAVSHAPLRAARDGDDVREEAVDESDAAVVVARRVAAVLSSATSAPPASGLGSSSGGGGGVEN